MKLCVVVVFLALSVVINGMPPISRDYNTHCRCLQVESRIIPPDNLRSIKILPEGPHCPDTEVIAGLASGEKVCLNPRSSWVKKLIHFVLEKQLHQQAPLPKNRT
ncbi:permeability factor 2-like [Seriola lalandi dorsalis]|uniref:Chemokine (C-X-C motif) ligand 19 n=1 Tax=Seriola lalandi dorsalis TaxID=1841481 RepID=A0A3B4X461_SERLL|nr:permeability factor 2-like [Seriola lalandi dorsalis]XP_056225981.1 C-X-C motif chemokine 19 [Seriola aureovittata]